MKFSFGDILTDGFEHAFKRNALILAGIQAGIFIIQFFGDLVLPTLSVFGFSNLSVLFLQVFIGIVVWLGSLSVSSAAMNTFVEGGETISDKWKDSLVYNILSLIGYTILIGIPILLVGGGIFLLAGVLGWNTGGLAGIGVALGVGIPLLLVLGVALIYVFSGLAFVSWRVYVENEGPIKAMKASWKLTRGKRWYIIGYYLIVGFGTSVGVALTFFVYPVTAALAQIISLSIFSQFYKICVDSAS